MKFFKTALTVLWVAATFAACKKDEVTHVFTMEGSWAGKIGTGSSAPSGQYALNIKPGGIIERVSGNGSVSATGTWQLEGDNFTATYNYPSGTIVNVAGTVDKSINKITADWSNNGGEQGTLYANKQ